MKMLILFVLLLLALPPLYASVGPEKTGSLDVIVEPQKTVFMPGEVMKVKITVRDKASGKPVSNASVVANVSIYQGGYTLEREVVENGRHVIVTEKLITKKIVDSKAVDQGNGVYLLSQKLNTQALWGGATITVTVNKGDEHGSAKRIVTFMGISAAWYALGVTLFALIAGSGVGVLFGHAAKP